MFERPDTTTAVRQSTLASMMPDGSWQLSLAHDRSKHLIVWVTRGQGVALLDGVRRGIGVHNAIFVPARSLFSIEIGRQGFAQVSEIPGQVGLSLPRQPVHVRTRDVNAQGELTGLFEAMTKEQAAQRPFMHAAMQAHAELIGIWLRRQMASAEPDSIATGPKRGLIRAYCQRITNRYASGAPMQDYAKALGVTPTHLSRVCRDAKGRTAAALLTERILHEARTLICQTDLSQKDIAAQLGIRSAAYFTRFIQHRTGSVPTALRRGKRL